VILYLSPHLRHLLFHVLVPLCDLFYYAGRFSPDLSEFTMELGRSGVPVTHTLSPAHGRTLSAPAPRAKHN
jgi:hypothetical protein